MPWHVESDNPECDGYAVVKDADGSIAGCHDTQAEADAQVAALYANEPQMATAGAGDRLVPMGEGTPMYGVAVVEGVDDGSMPRRQFVLGGLTFAPFPFPFKWQPAEAPGHDGSVVVGRVDAAWRDGSLIRFVGVMDCDGVHGAEAQRLIAGGFMCGVSIMADDIDETDIEAVYPQTIQAPAPVDEIEDEMSGDALVADMDMLGPMMMPEREIYHAGRIRSLTLVAEQAYVEATVCLGVSPFEPPTPSPVIADAEPVVIAAAVGAHDTATSDGAWDGPAAEKALASPMPIATARAMYAWVDDAAIADGQIPKTGGRFPHHEVSGGRPGAANVKACQTGIGVLNGGRGGSTIPGGDTQGVYDHLAAHLRDAGLEPPPLAAAADEALTAAGAYTITIPDVWPESWFDEPTELPPFGALNITREGRVYGLLAPAGVNHRAFRASGQRVTVPRGIDYSEFMNKPAIVAGADGQLYKIKAGSITFNCGHASPFDQRREDPAWASAHYENSCSIAARIRVGENKHGTWVAGGLLHGITPDTVERMMACALSGDWQGGKLNAALLVPVEGFPVAASSFRIRNDALVASSVPIYLEEAEPEPDFSDAFDLIASAVGRTNEVRWAELLRAVGR